MSDCPSCPRHVGPLDTCPHCGARTTGRMPVRVVKLVAVGLTTLGLAVLWFVATRAEVPTVAVGQVDATMNLAYIRVEGHCSRGPFYDPATDYLTFWLADETGDMRVVSYWTEARWLVEQDRLAALGDHIAVVGTVRLREDSRSLTINAPEQVSVRRSEPVDRPIGAITDKDWYGRVRVRGVVRGARCGPTL